MQRILSGFPQLTRFRTFREQATKSEKCQQETLALQQKVARSIGSPSKTRPSDARPAFTCVAAAADFPFPVHPHMPTHACGVPSQNQQKTQPKLVIVFRRAIFGPQERAHRRPTPATVSPRTADFLSNTAGRKCFSKRLQPRSLPSTGRTPTDEVFGRDRERYIQLSRFGHFPAVFTQPRNKTRRRLLASLQMMCKRRP